MNVKNEFIIIILILFTVLLLDGIMLYFLHGRWNKAITDIQGESLSVRNKIFPVVAYILIVLGIRIFVYPYFVDGDIMKGLMMGFMWGIITYGIFDFTNLSLFKDYPIGLALFDTLWGGILAALTGFILYIVTTKLKI